MDGGDSTDRAAFSNVKSDIASVGLDVFSMLTLFCPNCLRFSI